MSPRQAAFRAAYRAQIAPAYHGLIHVALIYLIGGAALWYAAQHIHRRHACRDGWSSRSS